MSAQTTPLEIARPLSFEDLFGFWNERCENFLAWQQENFILREPSAADLAQHSKRLNLMVRFTLYMYGQAADPENPMPQALRTITGRLKQLEDWRSVIHNPLSEADADAILARAFPDEAVSLQLG